MADQANKLGLLFIEQPKDTYHEVLRNFEAFAQADSVAVTHLLTGKMGGVTVSVMDYFIAIGYGRYASPYQQTIVFLPGAALGMPEFFLYPKSGLVWLEKIASKLMGRSLSRTCRANPAFNHQFFLSGQDREAIISCFAPEVAKLCLAGRRPDS